MFATIRRYDAIDQERTAEVVKKVDETLVPSLKELPGFNGYCVIEAGDGILSSSVSSTRQSTPTSQPE